MINRFQLLRNVGQFDSVDDGAEIPLAKVALIYAENGRGKTTISAILRSVAEVLCSLSRDGGHGKEVLLEPLDSPQF